MHMTASGLLSPARSLALAAVLASVALVLSVLVSPCEGFVYQPAVGQIWDPSLLHWNGSYYAVSMYSPKVRHHGRASASNALKHEAVARGLRGAPATPKTRA